MGEIKKIIAALAPAGLAKIRGRRQDSSTRDKKVLLSKIEEIETILEILEVNIIQNEKNNF